MRILALDRPLPEATMDQYAPYMRGEVTATWDAYKKGAVRDIYFRQDRPGVAIFLEADDVDEARNMLGEFPLVKAGLIEFEIIPLGSFTNWELLFAPSA